MAAPQSRLTLLTLASVAALCATNPALAQGYNWTGFYVGANAGGTWSNGDLTSTAACPATTLGYFCEFDIAVLAPQRDSSRRGWHGFRLRQRLHRRHPGRLQHPDGGPRIRRRAGFRLVRVQGQGLRQRPLPGRVLPGQHGRYIHGQRRGQRRLAVHGAGPDGVPRVAQPAAVRHRRPGRRRHIGLQLFQRQQRQRRLPGRTRQLVEFGQRRRAG